MKKPADAAAGILSDFQMGSNQNSARRKKDAPG